MSFTTFDEVLNLEEGFFQEGYDQGFSEGVKAGHIEGRTLGLEKGFEKFVESGKLHGKSIIWANRTPQLRGNAVASGVASSISGIAPEQSDSAASPALRIPSLPDNARLVKHVRVLYALAESDSLSTENSEDAVSDYDDRLKRAKVKAKMIERMAGDAKGEQPSSGDGSIEDVSVLSARH